MSSKCPIQVSCGKCEKKNHLTVMHCDTPVKSHGGESEEAKIHVSTIRTVVSRKEFKGQSCGKIVLVDVLAPSSSMGKVQVYALLDDQSNRSLISPELCNMIGITGETIEYTLQSCSGRTSMIGQRVSGVSIQSVSTLEHIDLPDLIECNYIPQDLNEIPTPDVANGYSHLKEIAPFLQPLNPSCGIHMLIGRDVPEAHHVKHQIIGPKGQPFAQELSLGWVIIGKVCLGKFHQPDVLHVYKTTVGIDGRGTLMNACENRRSILEHNDSWKCNDIFHKTPDDNKIGLSADDRQFVKLMESDLTKDSSGKWMAPLPFREPKSTLPNNRNQVLHRAKLFDKSLQQNVLKRQHMVEFMDKVFKSGAAEVAVETDKEKWYLPLFGVYHPRKPNQIRGVFDSSIVYEGKSLNEALLSGPNLTNSIVGVLLRFRCDEFAISADIEQMFYRFLVTPDHRRYLRFFWYQENKPDLPLVEYQMRVHVFGNRPSPAVATYGLRHAVRNADKDVREHVHRDFYVDDAFSSLPTREKAISLLTRTQKALREEGDIRLHKIASNDIEVMNEFPKDDLNKDLKDLNLEEDSLPQQQSLGLKWDLHSDVFQFSAPETHKPFSRRGLLSAMNSVYDPLGFLAPFSVSGKMLLREVCAKGANWDDELPSHFLEPWNAWNKALRQLHGYRVPRMFVKSSFSKLENPMVYVYTDASEKGIAAVAYLVADLESRKDMGFIMGKAKVAPKSGHSIPRLELCGAVLGVELGQCVSEHLDIPSSMIQYFTDSKVVLGYIYNRSRRFYTYVSNRVARIHDFSEPDQWNYIQTDMNPADAATRPALQDVGSALEKWHSLGPSYSLHDTNDKEDCDFDLQDPDKDEEVRPEVVVKSTSVNLESSIPGRSDSEVFETYSSWKRLVTSYAILIHIVRTFRKETKCGYTTWHVCKESTSPETLKAAKDLLIAKVQEKVYSKEIRALKEGKRIPRDSHILTLSPYLDDKGLLRLGGRMRHLRDKVGLESVNPLIIPTKCHVAKLLVQHYHEQTFHQGRHFTEGSLRSNGFWVVGAKRLVASVIGKCVPCRKLRGPFMNQRMADLPEERLTPGPPFTNVGVDVFGPWEIVTRKTRGGAANNKRWAVMFTCMTTRATHIEVIEDMSASCFINALTRLIAIRGPVKILWSDRGTNFIGAASLLKANVIHVEDPLFKEHLVRQGIVWRFNSPHSSHMGGIWERPIGIARRILESMLTNRTFKQLTHEVLCTFMYEVAAVMNSRPLVAVESDAQDPLVLSPSILLTQKQGEPLEHTSNLSLKEMYTSQWKQVQILSDIFWKQWRSRYLDTLQPRRKWKTEQPDPQINDLVLIKDANVARGNWPVGVITKLFPSKDKKVRKCEVRVVNSKGESSSYTRPIADFVMLFSENDA
ncbi:uncharacterized protein [Argopecten irradians]|uniref:uncharacterized protein n=2 Tax=Argopecten irradians TaxID=31199 RepID=UPI00371C206F